ncbi:hypothetical protein AB6A40_009879 [Gnathostoma spinigerum]|uniref:Uncharacterized protein n=1 Tax=Gnathostoma spinigerum TaxID=75299 RepID=A0ABD6EUH3_9BILA
MSSLLIGQIEFWNKLRQQRFSSDLRTKDDRHSSEFQELPAKLLKQFWKQTIIVYVQDRTSYYISVIRSDKMKSAMKG